MSALPPIATTKADIHNAYLKALFLEELMGPEGPLPDAKGLLVVDDLPARLQRDPHARLYRVRLAALRDSNAVDHYEDVVVRGHDLYLLLPLRHGGVCISEPARAQGVAPRLHCWRQPPIRA